MTEEEAGKTIKAVGNENKLLIDWFTHFTQVRNWMEMVLAVTLPPEPDKFIESLQDGIVLCYLCKEIDPRSIPRIQEDKSSAYRLRENITFFLAAVEDFGVPKHRIFSAADLSSKRIIPVVETLSLLAKRVVQPPPEGTSFAFDLPEPDKPVTLEYIRSICPDETLSVLTKQINPLKSFRGKNGIKPSSFVIRQQIRLMTGEGSFPKFERGITLLQARWRGYQTRIMFHHMIRDQAYRENVAKEIKQTETDYVSQLETCITVFYDPLEKAAVTDEKTAPITKAQIDAIFINIRDIYAFHKSFLKFLTARYGDEQWTPSKCLGDIFLRFKLPSVAEAYSKYAKDYPSSIECFNNLRTKKDFGEFLLQCREKSRLDLPSLLITPVQRVPRYELLLKDYNKHTWDSHRDKPLLNKAIGIVHTMAEIINTTKTRVESELRLKQLFETVKGIPPEVNKPDRVVVTEASFMEKRDPICFVLFKDALLVYRPGRKESKFVDCIDLWCLDVETDPKDALKFSILRNKKKVLMLTAKDIASQHGFVRLLRDTKKSYEEERARVREKESESVKAKRASTAYDVSGILVSRNSKSLSREAILCGKLSEKEKKTAIQELHAQRITIQQQLLSLEKSKIKMEERALLSISLHEQLVDVESQLEDLGVTLPAHHHVVSGSEGESGGRNIFTRHKRASSVGAQSSDSRPRSASTSSRQSAPIDPSSPHEGDRPLSSSERRKESRFTLRLFRKSKTPEQTSGDEPVTPSGISISLTPPATSSNQPIPPVVPSQQKAQNLAVKPPPKTKPVLMRTVTSPNP